MNDDDASDDEVTTMTAMRLFEKYHEMVGSYNILRLCTFALFGYNFGVMSHISQSYHLDNSCFLVSLSLGVSLI